MGVAPEFERLWRDPVLASQQDTLLQLQPLIEQTAGDQRADHPGDPQLIVVMTIQEEIIKRFLMIIYHTDMRSFQS